MEQNKSLKNVSLKKWYDPCVDGTDIVNDVYIPCLSNSIKYDRIAAYFCSEVLQLYSAGLVELYRNGGHARYIFSCEIDDDEMQEITKAYKEKMYDFASELDDDLVDDYNIANLSYLIKHNLVDIKIAFMIKYKTSMMHIKQGIFEDAEGNVVCFDGSGNESPAGLKKNCEHYSMHNNFNGPDDDVGLAKELFEAMWNNQYSPGNIYATTPEGPLFEKLCSYSRDKLFDSQEEYSREIYNRDVYVDMNENTDEIYVFDYTDEKSLAYATGIKSKYLNRLTEPLPNTYVIKGITLNDLRDNIPALVNKFGETYHNSKRVNDYIREQNLNIGKRVKIGMSIKQKRTEDSWFNDYKKFKEIVNRETQVQLKEDQLLNAFHHLMMKSSMDFSVPGTGKTYISYGLFAYLNSTFGKERNVDKLVVIGPLACFRAWIRECKALFGNRYTIYNCSEHKDENIYESLKENKCHIYLFNYEFFQNDANVTAVSQIVIDDRTMIVLDEVHRIKKISGTRSSNIIKTLGNATKKPVYKLALTGTPLPNSYLDLYNYIKILYQDDMSGFLSNFSEHNLQLADKLPDKAQEVHDSLYPLFTRTTKQDLNIPPANDDNLEALRITPSVDEELLYEYVYKSYIGRNALVRFIRLIQAASNPKLLLSSINKREINEIADDDYGSDDFDSETSTIYLQEITELVNKIPKATKTKKTINFINSIVNSGKKAIVWCLFIDTITLMTKELSLLGINCAAISGVDSIQDRNAKIDSFLNGSVSVIVTNPNTLAESVSLHTACHDAIYLEYGFNLTYMLQSKDRIHRVGLPEGTETNYYFAISDGTNPIGNIDSRVYERLKMKENRMLSAIESNDLVFVPTENDLDDIKFIIDEMDSSYAKKS